jgi:AcrR family transcriptional regulator
MSPTTHPEAAGRSGAARVTARDRILESAYELFSQHGIRAVGIDRIVAESGVAKMSLYRNFASKQELVLAFLELREQRWTREWLEAAIDGSGELAGRERVLGLFDLFDEWFHRPDFDGCSFINAMLEFREPADPIHQEAARQADVVKDIITRHLADAGAPDPERLAYKLQTLMMGSIVSAFRGDLEAARRAREVAELLL